MGHSDHRRRGLPFVSVVFIGAVTLLAAVASPVGVAAQDVPGTHHYRLVDLGTLGGPAAYNSVNGFGYQIINDDGVVSFQADNAMRDPQWPAHPDLCYVPDCFVTHTALWKNGAVADLGALPGNGNGSAPGAISARGWIIGQSENGQIDPASGFPEVRATLWKDGQVIDLGTFGGNWSLGISVNDAGSAAGFASNTIPDDFSLFPASSTQTRAFLWQMGVLRDLGTLGGNDAEALSMNVPGQVAGIAYTGTTVNPVTGIPTIHPFLWENGKMIDLGTLGGTYAGTGSCSFAQALCNGAGASEGSLVVNNRGQVTATSNLAGDQIFHPFLWVRGKMLDLGTLGGADGTAYWLTNEGDVVGQADLPSSAPCSFDLCVHHGFLWKRGVMTDLGTLGTDPCSRAFMSNSKGQIVGATSAHCGGRTTHAFLWEKGGPMVDLNRLIPAGSAVSLYEADNINERGEIVAGGLPAGCHRRARCGHFYLLIPCEGAEGCNSGAVDKSAAVSAQPDLPKTSGSRQQPVSWRRLLS